MRLKTSHGAYLVAREDGALLHLPHPSDQDFSSVWNVAAQLDPVSGLVEAAINEGPLAPSTLVALADGRVAFRRDGLYLCADPTISEVRFDRTHVGGWERFAIENSDGTLSRHPSTELFNRPPRLSRPVLIETLAGYQIMPEIDNANVVTVTTDFSKDPITRYTMPDGSWIVDVDGAPDLNQPFLVYWFYPFDDRIHVWGLDPSGGRVDGRDLSDGEVLYFLLGRRSLGPNFTSRLYRFARKADDWATVALLNGDLCEAAMAGSAEALYTALSHPLAFSPATVRDMASRALRLIRAIVRARTDQVDRHLKKFAVEALTKALTRLDPALGGLTADQLHSERDFLDFFSRPELLPTASSALPFSIHHDTVDGISSLLKGYSTDHTLAVLLYPNTRSIDFYYPTDKPGTRTRMFDSMLIAYYALSVNQDFVWKALAELDPSCQTWAIRFEVGDGPGTSEPSVAFERRLGDTTFALVPDQYYFISKGFQIGWFSGDIPPWSEKTTSFMWRGSTTGGGFMTAETMWQAPRVRLCELGRAIGPVADFGVTAVVQGPSEADEEKVKLILQDRHLWRERTPQHVMGGAKFLVEIDGNANSWGFLAKLLMGCCVLKVDSPLEQWFYDRLQPWVHYVPIAIDLSDLSEKVQWCLDNEDACREIAAEGKRLAEALNFEAVMASTAGPLISVARPLGR